MGRKSQKDAILDAAEKVIARGGLSRLTLEGVATEAGISKGGLLYHFSSKKDLILCVVERYNQRLEEKRLQIRETLPDTPGRDFKSYLLARLNDTVSKRMTVSKMVGMIEDAELREYLTESKKRELKALGEFGANAEKCTILVLAMEGLRLMDWFNIPAFTPEFRARVVKEILEMVDEVCSCSV